MRMKTRNNTEVTERRSEPMAPVAPARLESAATTAARRQGGFAMIELLVSIGAVIVVIMATVTTYLSTTRSWEGTATLTRVQREASFAMEVMGRAIRQGSSVDINADGDSLRVLFWTGSTDSLLAMYYVDGQGCLRDHSGTALVEGADSLSFASSDGRTTNIDIVIRGDMGTEDVTCDDQLVLMSSTIACRN